MSGDEPTGDVHVPLCVDLDDTLVRTDTLHESLLRLLVSAPLSLAKLLPLAFTGRARFKDAVAARVTIDVGRLPLNSAVVDMVRREKERGRKIVLATAAHHSIADAVAASLGIFDLVLATREGNNLKSARKGEVLREMCGAFDYIGDSVSDIPVFRLARKPIVVDRGGVTTRRIHALFPEAELLRENDDRHSAWRLLIVPRGIEFAIVLIVGALGWELGGGFDASLAALSTYGVVLAAQVFVQLLRLETDRGDMRSLKPSLATGAIRVSEAMIFLIVAAGSALMCVAMLRLQIGIIVGVVGLLAGLLYGLPRRHRR